MAERRMFAKTIIDSDAFDRYIERLADFIIDKKPMLRTTMRQSSSGTKKIQEWEDEVKEKREAVHRNVKRRAT